jgi:hypothetical protein
MRIILDSAEAEHAFQLFLGHLSQECRHVSASVRWRGSWLQGTVLWHAGFRFWFSHRSMENRHWLQFGLRDPSECISLEPVCEMSIPKSGFDKRMNGFFVRFGKDVLLANTGKLTRDEASFTRYLDEHGYDLTAHSVTGPDGKDLQSLILTSILGPSVGYNVFRFVSAVNDYRQWNCQGLLAQGKGRLCFGHKAQACVADSSSTGESRDRLTDTVVSGTRDQLEKFINSRSLRYKVGSLASSDIVLTSPDNTVLAAFHVTTDLSPASLYTGVGQLLLSRSNIRAAKFLVIPGSLGPFFTQALFRHDIHATPYKLTPDMGVVLDAQAVFAAIQSME